jgi:hypothetical protein
VFANCSVADQQLTQTTAQGICDAASPPVQLPSLASLLNSTNSSTSASTSTSESTSISVAVTLSTSSSGSSNAAAAGTSSVAATATSHSSASGRIDGDMRIGMALAAMLGVVLIAFFAV